MRKTLKLLGATGSIGKSSISVIEKFRDKIDLIALSFGQNVKSAEKILEKFHPLYIASLRKEDVVYLKTKFPYIKNIFWGKSGIEELSRLESDITLIGISGADAIVPTINAFNSSRKIALANKESVVMAGHIINRLKHENKIDLIPVDSEHSAIFQSLLGEKKDTVEKIILTASGGPFRELSLEELKNVTPRDALKHPVWSMGKKVTIDSATLANKGLEIIEAVYLFEVSPDMVDVLVHPQGIVHSLVEFKDHSVKAQLSVPDMRLSIQYALFWPDREDALIEHLSLYNKMLEFYPPDEEKFPALSLAKEAIKYGGSMTTVYNRANEEAVKLFLNEIISFIDIPKIIENAMNRHIKSLVKKPTLTEILNIDKDTKDYINLLY